jgi:hypothetical protein
VQKTEVVGPISHSPGGALSVDEVAIPAGAHCVPKSFPPPLASRPSELVQERRNVAG